MSLILLKLSSLRKGDQFKPTVPEADWITVRAIAPSGRPGWFKIWSIHGQAPLVLEDTLVEIKERKPL